MSEIRNLEKKINGLPELYAVATERAKGKYGDKYWEHLSKIKVEVEDEFKKIQNEFADRFLKRK